MESNIMTIKEVAEYPKLDEKTACRLTAKGQMPDFKVGGSWRFRESEIDRWIIKQQQQQEG